MYRLKSLFAAGASALTLLAAAAPSVVQAQTQTYQFNIQSQSLGGALRSYGQAAGQPIIFSEQDVRGKRAPALIGAFTADEALHRLLAGSGLHVQRTSGGVVYLGAGADDPGQSQPSRPEASQSVSELVVTAEKRSELLLKTPVPVTAVRAEALAASSQVRLQDYYSRIPGLDFGMDNRGSPAMSIRGLTTGAYVTPTVGFTVDDVPYGSAVVLSSFSPAPDIDPSELSRIEVLRGPQGTLYGASSLGGLIKYVTLDPSTSGVSGRVQAGVEGISHGHGVGYNLSGSVNLPVSDTLAVRANAFSREDPGYIDNILTGEKGVNETRAYGGHFSALWRPNDALSLKLAALYQHGEADGSSQVDRQPGVGDLEQSYLGGLGGYTRELEAYSANLTYQAGPAQITSITGYNRSTASDSYDVSSGLGGLTGFLYGVGGVAWVEQNLTKKFTQEVRLSTPIGSRFDWLVGLYYDHERAQPHGGFTLVDPASYQKLARVLDQRIDQTYTEEAVFSDLTIHFTSRFDVQVGARQSHNSQDYSIDSDGPLAGVFFGQTPPIIQTGESKDSPFTYLVTPRLNLTDDMMVYGRLTSGYRPGGPNAAISPTIPPTFGPDRTTNYEIGLKGGVFDHRLIIDASLYHIVWRNIQLSLYDPTNFAGYTDNAASAKSDGFELSLEGHPGAGIVISAWGSWNNSRLTSNLPANSTSYGVIGDPLPYSNRFSGSASIDKSWTIAGLDADLGATVSYVGKRPGEFNSAPARQIYPAYTKVDLRLSLSQGPWDATFFVNNVGDTRGLLAGGLGVFPAFAFNYIQPRTFGVNLARKF